MSRRSIYLATIVLVASLEIALAGSAHVTQASGGSISGRVINDLDGDGDRYDTGEPGLAGWRVVLEKELEGDEKPLTRETKTDRQGAYVFDNLPSGTFDISIPCDGQPSAWASTGASTYSAGLGPADHQEGLDLLVKLVRAPRFDGSLKGRVVLDEDRDTVPEPFESGIAGWTIRATIENPSVCDSQTLTTVSASDGSFSLSNLLPGSYEVFADGSPGGSGLDHWAFDAPGVSVDCGGYQCFQLSYDVEVPSGGGADVNFGVLALGGASSLSGAIYQDQNDNGTYDPGDLLLDHGCQIGLTYDTPLGYSVVSPDTFTSAPGGRYEISKLLAGSYRFGCLFGPGGAAINPPAGPNGFPEQSVTLKEGQAATADFGFGPPPGPDDGTSPTTTPIPPTVQPPSTSTPSAASAVSPPDTGNGPSSGAADRLRVAVAVAFAAAGVLALAARRRTPAKTRR